MRNEDTKEFASRSTEFYQKVIASDKEGSHFIEQSEFTINPTLSSCRIVLTRKNVPIELRYSEHHLDYDQGISVYIAGELRLQFTKFGVNLELRSNVEIVNEFLSEIAKLKL